MNTILDIGRMGTTKSVLIRTAQELLKDQG